MENGNDIKRLAKKAMDLYIYNHVNILLAIASVTSDVHTAIKIKEYININL